MIIGDINKKITSLTGVSTNSYTSAERLIDINIALHDVIVGLLSAGTDLDFDDARYTDFAVLTTSLVAAQRDYSLPVSEKILKIKRLDVTYNGTDYYKAEPIDSGTINFGLGNETKEDENFAVSSPRYDWYGNSIFVYPRASAAQVASGAKLRIEWQRQAKEFTAAELAAGTIVPGFEEPFHILLALIPAYEWQKLKDPKKAALIKNDINERFFKMQRFFASKFPDQQIIMRPVEKDYS